MNRYLLFAGTYYYPKGGFDDLIDSYDDLPRCIVMEHTLDSNEACNEMGHSWLHIVDTHDDNKIVISTDTNHKENNQECILIEIEYEYTGCVCRHNIKDKA